MRAVRFLSFACSLCTCVGFLVKVKSGFVKSKSTVDRGPWTWTGFFPSRPGWTVDRGWIPTAVMPPTQVDPFCFWMPGVLAMPTERLRISDMSSDDDAEPEIRAPIASKKGKLNVAAAAARGKLARGGASSRAPE